MHNLFFHFYAVCGISLALLASVTNAPDALAFFCRAAPTVTPGTPQRAFQNNRRHLDWLRAALQSRWSGGVAVGLPPLPPSCCDCNTSACHTWRRQEDRGVSDASFARHRVLKNIVLDSTILTSRCLLLSTQSIYYLHAELCIWPHLYCKFVCSAACNVAWQGFFFSFRKTSICTSNH